MYRNMRYFYKTSLIEIAVSSVLKIVKIVPIYVTVWYLVTNPGQHNKMKCFYSITYCH